jgi:hypothetical protein
MLEMAVSNRDRNTSLRTVTGPRGRTGHLRDAGVRPTCSLAPARCALSRPGDRRPRAPRPARERARAVAAMLHPAPVTSTEHRATESVLFERWRLAGFTEGRPATLVRFLSREDVVGRVNWSRRDATLARRADRGVSESGRRDLPDVLAESGFSSTACVLREWRRLPVAFFFRGVYKRRAGWDNRRSGVLAASANL